MQFNHIVLRSCTHFYKLMSIQEMQLANNAVYKLVADLGGGPSHGIFRRFGDDLTSNPSTHGKSLIRLLKEVHMVPLSTSSVARAPKCNENFFPERNVSD